MPGEDETVYAVWAQNEDGDETPDYKEDQYTLTYDGNGNTSGTVPAAEKHVAEAEVTLAGGGSLEKEKAVFLGWSQKQNGLITTVEGEAEAGIITSLTMPGEDETVYAVWAQNEDGDETPDYEEQNYTLKYDGNGNTSGAAPAAEEHVEGAEVTLAGSGSLEKEKAVFLGWSQNQNGLITTADEEAGAGIITSLTMPEEDETVYAVWGQDENGNNTPDYKETQITVTFAVAPDDAEKGSIPTEDAIQTGAEGTTLNVPAVVDNSGDDWIFDGWNPVLTMDGNGKVIVPKTDTTYTAVWAQDKNHNNVPDDEEEFKRINLQPYETTVYSGGSNNDTTDHDNSGFPNLDIQYVEEGRQIRKEAITGIYINDVNVGADVDEVFKAVYWDRDTTTAVENDQISDIYNVTIVLGEAALGAFAADSGVTARDGYLYDANGQRMPVRNQSKVEIVANEEASTARARAAVDSGLITYSVNVQDNILRVRPLTDPTSPEETYRSVYTEPSQITADAGAAAVIRDNSKFYTNGKTEREVSRDGIRLLVDTIQNQDMDREGMLIERANETVGVTDAQNWGYVARYFDLVDVNNGNAWVSSTAGTDVYLPYPEGTDQNTEFTLLHFEGLHREEGLTGDSAAAAIENCVPENMAVDSTPYGIKFHTTEGGFSPFVLMYRTAEETPDTPDDNDGNHGGNSGSSDSDRNIRTGSSRDSAYIVGVDGHWVHMDPANPNIPITVEVPEGATPVTNPEYHQWKFYLNSGLILWSRWAYVKNPYAVGEQPGEGWFYFDQDGIMQYGWYLDTKDNKWYYLHRTSDGMLGTLIEGWHFDNQDQKWYYLQYGTGEMLTGWQLIDGKWYYFNPVAPTATWNYDEATGGWTYNGSTSRPYGSMYQNEMTPDGYWVDENGAWVQ